MRRQLFSITTALMLTVAVSVSAMTLGQGAQPAPVGATRSAQQHLIGEVTAIDQTTGRLTVKTDAGASVTVATDGKTVYRRVPPGQMSLENAEQITAGDLKAGDRVLVPGGAALAPETAARQVIVMAREAVASRREQEREDWRQRGMGGRVVALDAGKREITIETRAREGARTITVAPGADARLLRYAPDSLRPADARPGTFADIRVGDQLRARGERSADDSRLAAEEVISGSVARVSGRISTVDAARGEVTVKSEQDEQTFTVAIGKNTTLRRIPREVLEELAKMREQRREQRRQSDEGERPSGQQAGGRRERRGDGERRRAGGGVGGGRNFQQLFENLPPITVADLKKGDAVVITGTGGADAARVTAATLVTGDAEFFRLLQRFLRGPGAGGPVSPGLPGDIIGGNTGGRDQPPQPPRQ